MIEKHNGMEIGGGLKDRPGGKARPFTRQRANARLIAAAPDFEQGARAFIAYEEAMDAGDAFAARAQYAAACAQLRAAIAKVEGRKP